MGFLGKLFGEAGAGTARGLMEGVGSLATSIRSAITGDLPPKMQYELEKLAGQADMMAQTGQLEVNLAEAKHTSIFVAGWRPFIGWVCGLSLAWNYLLYPMVSWYFALFRPLLQVPPKLDLSELMPVVLGILGLGVYRTYEKVKDVQKNH